MDGRLGWMLHWAAFVAVARGRSEFVVMEAELMRPTTIVLAHHDDWLPPVTKRIDTAPIRAELAHRLPAARLLEPEYLDPIRVLGA